VAHLQVVSLFPVLLSLSIYPHLAILMSTLRRTRELNTSLINWRTRELNTTLINYLPSVIRSSLPMFAYGIVVHVVVVLESLTIALH
jgi:hypothetical protein